MLRRYFLVFMAIATLMSAQKDDRARSEAIRIVKQIQRADYEGDRPALRRLFAELAPFAENKELGARVRYWRGFALWRRAINGFNESADPKDLEQDLQNAVAEFNAAATRDAAFADAKIAAASCLGNLLYLHQKEPDQVQAYIAKASPLLKEAMTSAPANPRLYWVLGPIYWTRPVENGGGQEKALATYQTGLDAVQKQTASGDALEPSWGEPELLMNRAWSYLHLDKPDLGAAERDAQAALRMVPYWHYVRDILIPQIEKAKAAAVQGTRGL